MALSRTISILLGFSGSFVMLVAAHYSANPDLFARRLPAGFRPAEGEPAEMIPGFTHIQDRRGRFLVRDDYLPFFEEEGLLAGEGRSGPGVPLAFPGGRGKLRRLRDGAGRRLVVRTYRHGGLFRALLRDLFCDSGRPGREVALMEDFRRWGIPTLVPVAGLAHRIGPALYRLRLVTEEEGGARDLVTFLQQERSHAQRRRVLTAAGRKVRLMHDHRVVHADLHPRNLLVTAGRKPRVLIIDLDRSRRVAKLGRSARVGALSRLARFLWKNGLQGEPVSGRRDWFRFLKGYFGRFDRGAREELHQVGRRLVRQLALHRWVWQVESFF